MAAGSTTSWAAWLAPTLTVLLALLISLAGTEIVRALAVRRLDALRSAHWTEQAHVFSETNLVTRLFRLYLIALTTVLLLLFLQPEVGSQQALRFGAFVLLLVVLVGDPLARRWVRRATAGNLAAAAWRDTQRFGLLMFPARWIMIVFAALAPARYDALGWAWAVGLLAALSCAQAGGVAWLARAVGSLRPIGAAARLQVEALARAAGVATPQVYEVKLAWANAMALPLLGWMVFTSGALERLEPRAVSAIAAHELGHLREPLAIRIARVAGGTSLFFVVGLAPAFPDNPWAGLGYGCGLFIIVAWGMRLLSRSLERRADKLARHQELDPGAYAAALERIYQLNWMSAGAASATHPSLYDRLDKAGARPSYARPPSSARGPRLLALAFGLVCSLFLVFLLNPMLSELFGGP